MNSSPLRRTLNTAKTFRQWYRQIQASSTSRFRNHTTNSASVAADKSFDTESKFDNYISGKSTHFGYESVNVKDKEGRVRMVFDKVADSYDIMNDMMSGGIHRAWKDFLLDTSGCAAMAKGVRSDTSATLSILDVAGGTGDVAFRFVEAAGCQERAKSSGVDSIQVTICDINPEMLRVGERRARERFGSSLIDDSKALSFVEGHAQSLPFESNSFDLYTIAFGLRNVTDVDMALREARRVLKPGGRFLCLEFSQVPNDYLRSLYDAYSFNVIPVVGEIVAVSYIIVKSGTIHSHISYHALFPTTE